MVQFFVTMVYQKSESSSQIEKKVNHRHKKKIEKTLIRAFLKRSSKRPFCRPAASALATARALGMPETRELLSACVARPARQMLLGATQREYLFLPDDYFKFKLIINEVPSNPSFALNRKCQKTGPRAADQVRPHCPTKFDQKQTFFALGFQIFKFRTARGGAPDC